MASVNATSQWAGLLPSPPPPPPGSPSCWLALNPIDLTAVALLVYRPCRVFLSPCCDFVPSWYNLLIIHLCVSRLLRRRPEAICAFFFPPSQLLTILSQRSFFVLTLIIISLFWSLFIFHLQNKLSISTDNICRCLYLTLSWSKLSSVR